MLSRMSSPAISSCRDAGGSRTAKRTPVARAVRMMCIIAIVAVGMMKPCRIPMHDGMMRLAFSCLNNSSVLIQVIS